MFISNIKHNFKISRVISALLITILILFTILFSLIKTDSGVLIKLFDSYQMLFLLYIVFGTLALLLFLLPGTAMFLLRPRELSSDPFINLKILFFSFFLSYFLFIIFFLSPIVGKITVGVVTIVSLLIVWKNFTIFSVLLRTRSIYIPLALTIAVSVFYLSLLFLFAQDHGPSVANSRYLGSMPIDNHIPLFFANCLYERSEPLNLCFHRAMGMALWQSSDRPPLFAAVIAQIRVFFQTITPSAIIYQYAGTFIQTTWIFGAWAIADFFQLKRWNRFLFLTVLIFSGFAVLHSVFLWPKLVTLSLFMYGFILVFNDNNENNILSTKKAILAGFAWGLATLFHGGIFFSILAAGVLLLCTPWKIPTSKLTLLVLAFLAVIQPWSSYKKYYDPPGNHVEIINLAGQKYGSELHDLFPGQLIAQNGQSTLSALYDSYTKIPFSVILKNKLSNLNTLVKGFDAYETLYAGFKNGNYIEAASKIRVNSFFYVFFSLGPILLVVIVLPYLLKIGINENDRSSLLFVLSLNLTYLLLWSFLMFGPNLTVIHQGSYATIPFLVLFFVLLLKKLPSFISIGFIFANFVWFYFSWLTKSKHTQLSEEPNLLILTILIFTVFIILFLLLEIGNKKLFYSHSHPLMTERTNCL